MNDTNVTRHVQFPERLDKQLKIYADASGRSITGAVAHLVDEALNGPLLLRMAEGRDEGNVS